MCQNKIIELQKFKTAIGVFSGIGKCRIGPFALISQFSSFKNFNFLNNLYYYGLFSPYSFLLRSSFSFKKSWPYIDVRLHTY